MKTIDLEAPAHFGKAPVTLKPRRRIWCETLPLLELAKRERIAALARYGIEPIVAVRPWDVDALPVVARACADAGLPFSIWPMVADADGRWASVWNARVFGEHAMNALRAAQSSPSPLEEVFIDLEPPIEEVRAMLRGPRAALRALRHVSTSGSNKNARIDDGRRALFSLAREIDERGARASAACIPLVLLDAPDGAATWQSILGTPVFGPMWRHVNVMLYTSMIEGWSRRLFNRDDARSLLASFAKSAADRLGSRASVSLGAVGTGALESEPTYRSPSELADDVAIARAAGVDDLALFDFGGVVARAPIERWLEAFAYTEPARELPAPTKTTRATFAVVTAGIGAWKKLSPIARR